MNIERKELLVIWRAISALETAYMVTVSQEKKMDAFGYWECVGDAQGILETLILSEEK